MLCRLLVSSSRSALLVTVPLLVLTGCGKTTAPEPTPIGATVFRGTFAAQSESGSLRVTLSTGSPAAPANSFGSVTVVTATATMNVVGGGSFALTGHYDTGSKQVSVSDGSHTLTGDLTAFGGSGGYTGPGVTGYWVAPTEASLGSVKVYCGTFASNRLGGPGGKWNVTIRGTEAHLLAVGGEGVSVILVVDTGTVSGTSITIPDPADPSAPPLATGTINGASITGTFGVAIGAGTWTATLCP